MLRPTRLKALPGTLLAVVALPIGLLAPGCTVATAGQPADQTATAAAASPAGTDMRRPVSPSPAATAGPPRRKAVAVPWVRTIVIDPGHSGTSIRSTDKTGLRDIDYPNYPEIYEMFDVSSCVAQALRVDGYRVLLTKKRALSTVGHRARATIANRAKADLAISVHNDHGVGARFQATYSQRGVKRSNGTYPKMYRGTGKHRTEFALPAVARRSDAAARAIARARTTTQQRPVSVTQNSYNGRAPLEPGNLALVQLFSTVPWVYNEMGALTGGSTTRAMSITSERRYAAGLLAGVEAAVPRSSAPEPSRATTATLTTCLRRQVEPTKGTFTRPKRYLPTGF
jgi:N-acetylmuramoyl-L-alanine amidase